MNEQVKMVNVEMLFFQFRFSCHCMLALINEFVNHTVEGKFHFVRFVCLFVSAVGP